MPLSRIFGSGKKTIVRYNRSSTILTMQISRRWEQNPAQSMDGGTLDMNKAIAKRIYEIFLTPLRAKKLGPCVILRHKQWAKAGVKHSRRFEEPLNWCFRAGWAGLFSFVASCLIIRRFGGLLWKITISRVEKKAGGRPGACSAKLRNHEAESVDFRYQHLR